MTYLNLDLWATVTLAVLGLVVQVGPVPDPIRVACGLLLVMFCPGYALAAMVFPGRLGWPKRALITLGLSLAVAIVYSVVFNWSLWGLAPGVWAGIFLGTTVAASVAAMLRRPMKSALETVPPRRLSLAQFGLLCAAGLITISAVVLVREPRPASGVLGYTMLWMTPEDPPNDTLVRLGVRSNELAQTSYKLEVTFNGQPLETWNEITLAPGETWEQLIALPQVQPGGSVEARLYRLSSPEVVYRQVKLAITN